MSHNLRKLIRAKQEFHGNCLPLILSLKLNKKMCKMILYSASLEFNSRTKLPAVTAQDLSYQKVV